MLPTCGPLNAPRMGMKKAARRRLVIILGMSSRSADQADWGLRLRMARSRQRRLASHVKLRNPVTFPSLWHIDEGISKLRPQRSGSLPR